ncbi:hypothetical protein SEA_GANTCHERGOBLIN_40 [Arthrobacter phage GantcherGoblin]|nr:hypothetical protein SEA_GANTCHERGOBLIN_40 [Arthrobacter phage GantcherGoblin]
MADQLFNSLPKISRKFATTMDEFIINFFGGEEAAKSQIHLYILEEYPMEFAVAASDLTKNEISYTTHQQFRLRLKTKEELEAEGSND